MMQHSSVSEKFVNEELAQHWNVTEDSASFERLRNHIENKTNFRRYFEIAFGDERIQTNLKEARVMDFGAGVGWHSALMALNPAISKVVAVEPSEARLSRGIHIAKHFDADVEKLEYVKGNFEHPGVSGKFDLITMFASLHHCWDKDIEPLFANLDKLLSENGKILIGSEHFVDARWSAVRLAGWAKNIAKFNPPYYSPLALRTPDPWDGEHWRTENELTGIFRKYNWKYEITEFEGDLCLDKERWYQKQGWHYYYAILQRA